MLTFERKKLSFDLQDGFELSVDLSLTGEGCLQSAKQYIKFPDGTTKDGFTVFGADKLVFIDTIADLTLDHGEKHPYFKYLYNVVEDVRLLKSLVFTHHLYSKKIN